MLIVWPSGSAFATQAAPISPPTPSLFSTITGWPRLAWSFSAMMRAVVSEALPGVTPDTRRIVLLGKCCASAAPVPSDNARAQSPMPFIDLRMASSSKKTSDLRQPELSGEPVGRPASIAVGAVVGIVPAVLDDQQLHRTGNALRQPLGVARGHQAILEPGHDEDRAPDLRRRIRHRQGLRVAQRIGLGRAVAAHAERLAGELRQPAPYLVPLERTGERDAGADALLVGGGARRVISAEAHAPHGDLRDGEVGAFFDPVARRAGGALVVAENRDLVLGFALPRSVDREDRDPAREERLLVGVQLLLGGIQSRRHDEHRGALRHFLRLAQNAVERPALERYRDAFPQRAHERKRRLVAFDRAHVRFAHLLRVVHENELGEVVVHARAHEMLAGAELVALRERLAPEPFVHFGALAPGAAPVLPALDPGGDFLEIGEQHAVRDEARRPVGDRRGDARVGGFCFRCGFGHERVPRLKRRTSRAALTGNTLYVT